MIKVCYSFFEARNEKNCHINHAFGGSKWLDFNLYFKLHTRFLRYKKRKTMNLVTRKSKHFVENNLEKL